VRSLAHVVPRALEQITHKAANVLVVVDDEDAPTAHTAFIPPGHLATYLAARRLSCDGTDPHQRTARGRAPAVRAHARAARTRACPRAHGGRGDRGCGGLAPRGDGSSRVRGARDCGAHAPAIASRGLREPHACPG